MISGWEGKDRRVPDRPWFPRSLEKGVIHVKTGGMTWYAAKKVLFGLVAAALLVSIAGEAYAFPVQETDRMAGDHGKAELPRVLILGDSISIGYTRQVKELLAGYAEVERPMGEKGGFENCGSTWMGLDHLERWLGDGRWDVIHFNWGLWDLCFRNPKSHTTGRRDKVNGEVSTTLEEYEANLRTLVARLKKTGARLIWTTSTPVPEGEDGRFAGSEKKYNTVAAKVMEEAGVRAVDDLWAAMAPVAEKYWRKEGDVHFTVAGYDFLAEHVAAAVAAELVKAGKVSLEGTVRLWQDQAPLAKGGTADDAPELTVYLPKQWNPARPGVVICPGGGYKFLAMGHEGKAVAEWLDTLGAAGFVLKYRNAGTGYRYPAPQLDAKRALRLVRARARMYGVDAHRIGIMGFSAGGHLACSVGTLFDLGDPRAGDVIDRRSSKPDFMILVYPVVTMTGSWMHRGSRNNLLGENPDPALAEKMSGEKQVTDQTPPAFLMHADDDGAVPPRNSIELYQALKKHHVPAEMHVFLKGGHGFAFRPRNRATDSWPELCAEWMRLMGFLKAPGKSGAE